MESVSAERAWTSLRDAKRGELTGRQSGGKETAIFYARRFLLRWTKNSTLDGFISVNYLGRVNYHRRCHERTVRK